jgi:hypothetical protein
VVFGVDIIGELAPLFLNSNNFSGDGKKVISGDLNTKSYHVIGFLLSLSNFVRVAEIST